MRRLDEAELTRSLDQPIDPRLPFDEWPIRPGWPGDCREGDPAFYRVMLPCCDRPLGVHLGHTWHEAGVLLRMVELAGIRRFVEVGMHAGGLSGLLIARATFDWKFSFLGIELNPDLVSPTVRVLDGTQAGRVTIAYGDCFSPAVKERVRAFVSADGSPAMIYCDDGNKPAEIVAYADVPRPGDILAAHDYWEPGIVIRDLPQFAPLEHGGRPFPGPEVTPADVAALPSMGFQRMDPQVWTPMSRIAAFVKV